MPIFREKRKRPEAKYSYYFDNTIESRMGKYSTRIETDFILQCLTALPEKPKIILDAGAGSGRFEPLLLNFASQIIATEVDSSLTSKLALFGDKVVPMLINGDSKQLPFNDSHFDCVICIEVPSLAEHDWFYAESRRILKKGGLLVTLINNRNSWKGAISKFKPERYDWGREQYYQNSIKDTMKSVQKHGLTIRRSLGLHWLPFTRASNNHFVSFFAKLESTLQLRKLVRWSPWVMLELQKTNKDLL